MYLTRDLILAISPAIHTNGTLYPALIHLLLRYNALSKRRLLSGGNNPFTEVVTRNLEYYSNYSNSSTIRSNSNFTKFSTIRISRYSNTSQKVFE